MRSAAREIWSEGYPVDGKPFSEDTTLYGGRPKMDVTLRAPE